MAATAGQRKPVFRIENVRKEYHMGEVTVSALRGVSLDIFEGEFLVILGPSGSGKSTLLNIIGGLDAPSSGTVRFRQDALDTFSDAQRTRYRRHNIGFIFQFYNLMPNLTTEENVELATEITNNAMDPREALRMVELDERRGHFPSQLSGGEQQRVAIARAVAKRPQILLCDEPTGALDITTGKIVLRVLQNINKQLNTTVVVITHNASIGGMANRVVRMKDGGISDISENLEPRDPDELDW
jgi:putative ABC transport system ATP-binding protein